MSWVALGVGVLGAGASIYGASQQPEGVKRHELPVNAFNPGADPLLAALTMNAGTGVGQFDPNVYRQASPVQQLLAQAQIGGTLNRRQFDQLRSALSIDPDDLAAISGMTTQDAKLYLQENGYSRQQSKNIMRGLERFGGVVQSSGYGSIAELLEANQAYLGQIPALEEQFGPVAKAMREGILASQQRVGGYLKDLPNLLTGEANPFIDQLREETLAMAQRTGANPYNFLEQARSTALQRALQLIGGEQAAVGAQQGQALPIAQLRQAGGVSAAQIGSAQSNMLANAYLTQQGLGNPQAGGVGDSVGQWSLILGDLLSGINRNNAPALGNVADTTRTDYRLA